jgi:hypothetical protein
LAKRKYKTTERQRRTSEAWQARNPARVLLNGARFRARRKGRAFSLTTADVEHMLHEAGTRCGGCGGEMVARSGRGPSLDRIDNAQGYTPDNVAVMCKACNTAKGVLTGAELLRLAQFVLAQETAAALHSSIPLPPITGGPRTSA